RVCRVDDSLQVGIVDRGAAVVVDGPAGVLLGRGGEFETRDRIRALDPVQLARVIHRRNLAEVAPATAARDLAAVDRDWQVEFALLERPLEAEVRRRGVLHRESVLPDQGGE